MDEHTGRIVFDEDVFCQECGYNLRGLTGDRCPECGNQVLSVKSREPDIPWVYRKSRGLARAYLETVFRVSLRQRRFCAEMAREVDFNESRRFRRTTIGLAFIPFALATIVLFYLHRGDVIRGFLPVTVMNSVLAVVVVNTAWMTVLLAITGIPSWFFHPRTLTMKAQNRAIALTYYASGPLAFSVIWIGATVLATTIQRNDVAFAAVLCVAITVPVAQMLVWWFDLIHLSRRLTPSNPLRTVAMAVFVPVLVVAIPLLALGLPALAITLGWVIFG